MSTQELQHEIGKIPQAGLLIAYHRGAAQTALQMHAAGHIRSTAELVVLLGHLRVAGHTPEDMANGNREINAKLVRQIMHCKASFTEDINVEIANRAIAALKRIGIRFLWRVLPDHRQHTASGLSAARVSDPSRARGRLLYRT